MESGRPLPSHARARTVARAEGTARARESRAGGDERGAGRGDCGGAGRERREGTGPHGSQVRGWPVHPSFPCAALPDVAEDVIGRAGGRPRTMLGFLGATTLMLVAGAPWVLPAGEN